MALSKENSYTFSSSTLKLLACGFMLIDHVGVRLFPGLLILRIIGRLAFPIFAFFIGVGCQYTSNKLRHFLSVFLLGLICEVVYIIYTGGWYGNILLTFSLSILVIYLLQWSRVKGTVLSYSLFAAILAFLAVLMERVSFDYGFFGMILPLLSACISEIHGESWRAKLPLSKRIFRLVIFSIGIMLTSIKNPLGMYQLFALLAVPLLALYNGRPGNKKLKYFFYIFYPVHLLLIEAAAMLQ